ncbi:MAG: TIGR03067 domain-containing protein [Acidobacteriia bacterium]|nr:TIGR03067 domain-containing protein [Terriglobia bacterium]
MATDLDKLQGSWDVTSLEMDGRKMPAVPGAKIVIKGGRFTSLGMGQTYEGKIEIDQKKTPRAIDLVFTAGPQTGTRNLGIYTFGRDRWTLCLATYGDTRPRTFATKPGTGVALETLEREGAVTKVSKKAPAKQTASRIAKARAAEAGPVTPLEGDWKMVSGVFNGAALADNMVEWCRRTTRGGLTTVMAGPQTMVKATFTLDTSTHPHAIDYVNLAGASRGKSQAGIFEIAGGELRICMAAPGKPRPTAFASKSGDGRSMTSWKRSD